eukprot:189368_1
MESDQKLIETSFTVCNLRSKHWCIGRGIQHKQNMKYHVLQLIELNIICTAFIEQKCLEQWRHSHQVSLPFKSAKPQHEHTSIIYWLHYMQSMKTKASINICSTWSRNNTTKRQ